MRAATPLMDLLKGLDGLLSEQLGGLGVQLQPIPGAVTVLQVSIEGREELPIFLTGSEQQILCLCYLWDEAQLRPERRVELLEALLDLNPSVPLSSFGRVGGRFVLTGALRREAPVQDVAKELAVLSDNALDALDALAEFFVED